MPPAGARARFTPDLRCAGSRGRAIGFGCAGVGSQDEQGLGDAAWRCGGSVTGQFWFTGAPQHDLPSGGAGGTPGRSHLACSARCCPPEWSECDRRNRLECGSATAQVMGGRERGGNLLRHSFFFFKQKTAYDIGSGLRRLAHPRWMGGVLQVSAGRTSKLHLPSGSSLPRHGSGVLSGSSPLPPASESHLGKRLGLAGPLSEAGDFVPWVVDGYRTVRSRVGSPVGTTLSRFRQPQAGETSESGEAIPVHLSLLSRSGCDEQCRRACFATARGGAQELEWEPNRERSARASRAQQHSGQCAPAGEELAGCTDRTTADER